MLTRFTTIPSNRRLFTLTFLTISVTSRPSHAGPLSLDEHKPYIGLVFLGNCSTT